MMKKLFHPVTLFVFVILVAVMASQTNLGTDGITYAMVGSAVLLIAGIAAGTVGVRKFNDMLNGAPSMLDHMASPGGYRRARQAETEAEAARLSTVKPTPNRPLIVDADPRAGGTERALERASTRAVEKVPARGKGAPDALNLAPGLTPPLSEVVGRSTLFLGMRGAGKSFAVARFIEQLCTGRPLPALVLDYKGDYTGLPETLGKRAVAAGSPGWADGSGREYWGIHPGNAKSAGWNLLEYGRQVVLQLGSYASLDAAADIMCKMIDGMFQWSRGRTNPPPVIVCLDEAQQFLPQDRSISAISPEKTADLLSRFERLNSVGRSLGYTLIIATQRPAQIRKEVIGGTEIYFLMKQTQPVDLKMYAAILNMDATMVKSFQPGEALVLESGESFRVRFHERVSTGGGATPGMDNAYAHYGRDVEDISHLIRLSEDEEEEENDDSTPLDPPSGLMNDMPALADMPNPAHRRPESEHQAAERRPVEEIVLEKALRYYQETGVKTYSGMVSYLVTATFTEWTFRTKVWPRFQQAVKEKERAEIEIGAYEEEPV